MVPNEKSGIISTDVNSGFINVETFDSDDACNRGTHVLHSACKPKGWWPFKHLLQSNEN